MANQEQLEILKRGIKVWNDWRIKKPDATIDFSHADLQGKQLIFKDFSNGNFIGTNLRDSILFGSNFEKANLSHCNLRNADLRNANLNYADLTGAKLNGVNFWETKLIGTNLDGAWIGHSNMFGSSSIQTILGNLDLNNCINLDLIHYSGPSLIDDLTLTRSRNLSDSFLRGIGLSDWRIESYKLYNPDLTPTQIVDIVYKIDEMRSRNPIQIANLFISYSHKDASFIKILELYFEDLGVRYWRDIHDAPAGPLEEIVVRGMQGKTVLLVLSKDSIQSDWCEWELEKARELEKKGVHKYVLCPIAIDDSWKTANWPGPLMSQVKKYNILDFSDWENHPFFENQMKKLLRGLKLFYGKEK